MVRPDPAQSTKNQMKGGDVEPSAVQQMRQFKLQRIFEQHFVKEGGVFVDKVDSGTICQVAIVVKDLDKAVKYYSEIFNVEPPNIFSIPPQEEAKTQYRGVPTATRARLAVFKMGNIVLELTEPDSEPSSWKEFLDTHGEGVHHIGFMIDDRDAVMDKLAKLGIPVRHYGEYTGGSYTVVDSEKQLGILLNLKHEPK